MTTTHQPHSKGTGSAVSPRAQELASEMEWLIRRFRERRPSAAESALVGAPRLVEMKIESEERAPTVGG